MKLAKAEAIYRPNILINGDFQVWQRGDSTILSNVSETGYKYFADRWCRYFSSTSSASETYEKVSNGMKYTSTTQPNATITQLLETGLKSGNKYTLSASVNDIIHVMTFDGQVDKSEGILSYIKGVSTIPYDRIMLSISNNDILNWVKLEAGSIATPLIPRLYAEELALCQRYYETELIDSLGCANYRICDTARSHMDLGAWQFKVEKSTIPKISFSGEPTYERCSNLEALSITLGGCRLTVTTIASNYRAYGVNIIADAEIY